jgi:Cu+-exporting ATPase
MAVAGFCFGNAMLFSLPAYLAAPETLEPGWIRLFSILNVLLSLPVLFYSSTEFLSAAWKSLSRRTITIDVPLSLGILALFGRSIYEITAGYDSGYVDSFTGLVFFLLVGRIFQRKTFAALRFDRDYRSYFPLAATVVDGNTEHSIPLAALQVGNRIRVRHGELIPADSRLCSPICQIDYSYVTGESEPVTRHQNEPLFAGGRITGRATDLVITKTVSHSHLTRLWNNALFTQTDKSRRYNLIDAASRYFTMAVLAIAFASALYWLPQSSAEALDVFTAVLIIACPCALALSTPFTLGTAINALARAGLFLRDASVVEQLGRIDTVVFDKTGTLTSSRDMQVHFHGVPLSTAEQCRLATALNHSAHPLSRTLLKTIGSATEPQTGRFEEELGMGIRYRDGGEEVLVGSATWLAENGVSTPMTQIGGTVVYVAFDGRLRGTFSVRQEYRAGLDGLFARLAPMARAFLLSGDNDREKDRLQTWFKTAKRMRFQQDPADKLAFVEALVQQGNQVLMLGDGLNDAGALRHSSVGLAVSEDASAFTPASDGIIEAAQLPQLPDVLLFARRCRRIILASFVLSIAYNVIGLSFAIKGSITPLLSAVLMPLSSVSVIAFTTLTTRFFSRPLKQPIGADI